MKAMRTVRMQVREDPAYGQEHAGNPPREQIDTSSPMRSLGVLTTHRLAHSFHTRLQNRLATVTVGTPSLAQTGRVGVEKRPQKRGENWLIDLWA